MYGGDGECVTTVVTDDYVKDSGVVVAMMVC